MRGIEARQGVECAAEFEGAHALQVFGLEEDLRTELLARGGARLDASGTVRQDAYLNRAMQELAEDEEWPQLLTVTTGTTSSGALAV